jgi:hypothetical protein
MPNPLSNLGAIWSTSTEAINVAFGLSVTDTQSNNKSSVILIKVNGNEVFKVDKFGNINANSIVAASKLEQNRQSTGYTLVQSDRGKIIRLTGGNITIPSGIFANGEVIVVFNAEQIARNINGASGVTIYQTAANTTGNVTIGGYALATIICDDDQTNSFIVSGAGIE